MIYSHTGYQICLSRKAFPSGLVEAGLYCKSIGMKVCSLDQLVQAFDSGYRNEYLGLVMEKNALGKVKICNNRSGVACLCYELRHPGPSVVVYSPHKYKNKNVYCCKK